MQQAITDGDVQEMKELTNEYGNHIINDPEPSALSPVMRCVFEGLMAPLVAAGLIFKHKTVRTRHQAYC